jgi:uncharacterized membrane protein YvbJ
MSETSSKAMESLMAEIQKGRAEQMKADEDKKTMPTNTMIIIGLVIIFLLALLYFFLNKNESTPSPVIVSAPRFDGLTSSYGFVDKAISMFGKPQ